MMVSEGKGIFDNMNISLSGNPKKKRDNSTKVGGHHVRSSLGDPVTMKSLVDISDRYTKEGLHHNPYNIDQHSSKKSFKKKADSIDIVPFL